MEKFGRYILLERIAVGGMGEIFVAKLEAPAGFNKYVVIKRMLPTQNLGEDAVKMFFAEARMQAAISHSNLAQVYEMGTVGGAHFIAMEYIQGVSLRALQRRAAEIDKVIPCHTVIEIILNMCRGLGYAHEATNAQGEPLNIVHRDISPENILLGFNGDIKVIDFGVAKSNLNELKTETGTIKGKMAYMAPEQAMGKGGDAQVDVFAVGVCLVELLLGHNPYMGRTMAHTFDNILNNDPPLPSSVRADLVALDPVCVKVSEKDPKKRYTSLRDLASDLHQIIDAGTLPGTPVELSSLLRGMFDEHILQRQSELKSLEVQLTSQVFDVPTKAIDTNEGLTIVATPTPAPVAMTPPPPPPSEQRQAGVSDFMLQVAALGVVAILGAGSLLLYQRYNQRPENPSLETPETQPQAPAPQPETGSEKDPQIEVRKTPEIKKPKPRVDVPRPKRPKPSGVSPKKNPPAKPAPVPKVLRPTLRLNSYPAVRWQLGAQKLNRKNLRLDKDSGLLVFQDSTGALRATARFEYKQKKLSLRMSSQPWSLVFVDGKSRGRTPITIPLSVSKHVIEMRSPSVSAPLKIELERLE